MSQYSRPPANLAARSSEKLNTIIAWYDNREETVEIRTTDSDDSDDGATSDDDDAFRDSLITDEVCEDEERGCAGMLGKTRKSAVTYDAQYKVLVLGDTGVGKTSLIRSLMGDEFCASRIATIGIDFVNKSFEVDGARVRLQIWDTAGQERFRSITKFHYRGTQGLLLVYDVTDPDSLETINFWLKSIDKELDQSNEQPVPVFMVANKVDLSDQRQISFKEGQKVADRYCVEGHLETSAKENTNVVTTFYRLAHSVTEVFNKSLLNLYRNRKDTEQTPDEMDGEEAKKEKIKKRKRKWRKRKKKKKSLDGRISLTAEDKSNRPKKCNCS